MMVHIHRAEERQCDSCGRTSVVCDVRGERSERGLSLCQKCFRDFTSTLVEAAGRIKGDLEAAASAHGT
jgi:ribosomal protein L37AE/L43A